MDWLVASVISAIALSGQALMFQRLQRHYPIQVYVTYIWLGSALALSLSFLRPEHLPLVGRNLVPLLLTGVGSWAGTYCYNRAIAAQPNIGYVEAVIALRIAAVYLASVVVFGAGIEARGLVGVVCMLAGVLALSGLGGLTKSGARDTWLKWAVTATAIFSLMTILFRFATDDGVPAEIGLIVVFLVAGILFIINSLATRSSLRLRREHGGPTLAAIAFSAVGNGAAYIALQAAPNLAYPLAIDNSRIIILYVVGLILYSQRLQLGKAVGVGLAFAGILLLI